MLKPYELLADDEKSEYDFVNRFLHHKDVRPYQGESYYYSFMSKNYSGPISTSMVFENEDIEVYQTSWGEMEVNVNGVLLFDKHNPNYCLWEGLEGGDVSSQLDNISFEYIPNSEYRMIKIEATSSTFEVVENMSDMPERGGFD